jgi:hypothetical protein
MAGCFACEVASRFLSLELVAFRTWEPALRTAAGGPGPFQPGRVFVKRNAYGDLASLGNQWRLRQYHDEEIHIDRLGYRNSYDLAATRFAGIVAGDSFVVATGLTEADTLPGQLARRGSAPYYNAGGPNWQTPTDVIALADELRLPSGVVVVSLLERRARYDVAAILAAPPFVPGGPAGPPAPSQVGRLASVAARFAPAAPSPLRIASEKTLKLLQDDVIRPNPYATAAVQATLLNGEAMLFLPSDLDPITDAAQIVRGWAAYFKDYADALRARHLRLVVALVPNKHTVYGPLTIDGPRGSEGASLLSSIEMALRAANVPVVNVTAELTERAAEALPLRRYVYWRDDTHWNADGVALAADAVWQAIARMQSQG